MLPAGLIAKIGGGIIDKIFPSDADKAKKLEAKTMLLEAEQKGEFIDLETRMNAIVMEANSKHLWVALARPSFLYVMYFIILMTFPMGVVFAFWPVQAAAITAGMQAYLAAIPTPLWGLMGAGYLGYTKARENDKARLMGSEPKRGLLSALF